MVCNKQKAVTEAVKRYWKMRWKYKGNLKNTNNTKYDQLIHKQI